MLRTLARLRVPLGFVCGGIALWLAEPSARSLMLGSTIAVLGEALRVWAAGHIDKGREVTRSGPYRFVRHPLYLGSSIMAAGFVVASRSVVAGLLVLIYFAVTLLAAIRTEEAALESRFGPAYSEYRAGRGEPVRRAFSLGRVRANREYRAVIGMALGFLLLYARSR